MEVLLERYATFHRFLLVKLQSSNSHFLVFVIAEASLKNSYLICHINHSMDQNGFHVILSLLLVLTPQYCDDWLLSCSLSSVRNH